VRGGGVLPELTYKTAIMAFGQHGAAELSYLVGLYALVSITLNTFDGRYRRLSSRCSSAVP
jgi:4-carboxymuconolactone decarboxylase